jgi:hypothetical protein
LRAAHFLAVFIFQIGYAFSFIKIPSWLLLLSGTRLEMLNSDDFTRINLSNGRKTATRLFIFV